jgi:4-amino-4-deoxy-L-arabinose transferase-like glycosyltransferase
MQFSSLADTIERRPQAVFAGFLALHGVVWTALPALLYANLPLDLIEALTYGREWQLGYDKLPPLPWWMVEVTYRVFGVDTAYYAFAEIVVLVAFMAVWLTARPLVGAAGALAAILIIDGMHYFNFTAVKFNHDVIQLPFWAFAGFAFRAGLRQGRLGYWLLLGFCLGMAFWAKYFMPVLAVPLALFVLIDRDAQKSLSTPGPWIAALVALIVMAPHLVWLYANDFLPFRYADARSMPARGLLDHALHPLEFLVGQLFFLLPALLIAAPLAWPWTKTPLSDETETAKSDATKPDAFDRRIVTLLAFGPAATLLALTLITGRGTITMWGYPLWLFLGLWIVMLAPAALARARLLRIGALWAAVATVLVAAFVADYAVLPPIDHRYRAVLFPGEELSAALTQRFRIATGRDPAYVIGSMWDGGNVAHYSALRPQPRVLIDGQPERGPWIDLGDLRSRGAIVVWTAGDPRTMPPAFTRVAAAADLGEPFDLPFRRGGNVAHVGWAILRPQPQYAAGTDIAREEGRQRPLARPR